MKRVIVAVLIPMAVTIAGCGGGGSAGSPATTAISGTVADGYLSGAEVFLDKNGNYQWDGGEPMTTTDANGAYRMTVSAADASMYPIVVRAIAGTTIDKDTNTAVANGYVMSAPAGHPGFKSPMTTLVREKMTANPATTLTDAMTQLRNQMNLPAGIDVMADYMAQSLSGTNAASYQTMHSIAQQMAGLMGRQANLVMPGSSVQVNRYRDMMATINANMSGIAANALNGLDINSPFMTTMRTTMQSQIGAMPTTGGFVNYSALFRNMTSNRYYWNNTTPMTPMRGSMM